MNAPVRRPHILFVVPSRRHGPSTRVRVLRFVPVMQAAGFRTTVVDAQPAGPQVLAQWAFRPDGRRRNPVAAGGLETLAMVLGALYRVVLWSRLLVMAGRVDAIFFQWGAPRPFWTRCLRRRPARLIYDFDDAVYLYQPANWEALVRGAWRVIAGSRHLEAKARALNPATVRIPSTVPDVVLDLPPRAAPRDPARLGWLGGTSTLGSLEILREPLEELARRGRRFELLVAGCGRRPDRIPVLRGVTVRTIPDYDEASMPRVLEEMDVGLMPLRDGEAERGKCAMKALLYMAASRPAVSSAVGEILHIVHPGEDGLIVRSSADWVAAIEQLLDDHAFYRRLAEAGRNTVRGGYGASHAWEILQRDVLAPLARGRTDGGGRAEGSPGGPAPQGKCVPARADPPS